MVLIHYRVSGRTAREISASLEAGIRSGALPPGELLPAVRALASELQIAPGTAAAAYQQLRDRGLVHARGRAGTYVSARTTLAGRSRPMPVQAGLTDLASGQPDPRLLPELSWASPAMLGPAGAPAAFGLPELLELARARFAADGVTSPAMTIAAGGLDSIYRVLSTQLRAGDAVAVEDPGWPKVLDLIPALGLRSVPVSLDAQGPRPEPLRQALHGGARAVIITSRAQNPAGLCVTRERASQLRVLLAAYPQTLVIEDDHAAELADVPLAPLAGATRSWAFVRSTSKPYGPDLRVALIAGDEATIARVDERMRVGSGWVSTLLQRQVLGLWTSARAAAVIARAGQAYSARRGQLITELARRGIMSAGETGLNVWIPVADETTTVASLLQAGWAVAPGARFRQDSAPGIRITVSALTTSAIPRLAGDIAAALADAPASAYIT